MFHVLISLNGKDRDKKRNRFYKKGRFLFRSLHGNKAFFRCHPQHIPICGFPFVRYNTVEYGIFNGRFYLPHNTARSKRKECHYLFSGNRRLKIPYAVFLLNIMQLGTHKCKIIEYAAHLLLIFRSNVGLAKQHERIDVITGIEKQTTDSRVGYFIFYKAMGRMCNSTIFCTNFIFSFIGNFIRRNIPGIILAPT